VRTRDFMMKKLAELYCRPHNPVPVSLIGFGMHMTIKFLGLGFIFVIFVLSGCTSMQVTKVAQIGSKEICIVDNPKVWQSFRDAYERKIQAKGYKTQIVIEAKACQVSTTYSAKMSYDGWGPYLSQAELRVFDGENLAGQANYHAPMGLASHGGAENKIQSMVDQMLPFAAR
jgi:hypothetical protein